MKRLHVFAALLWLGTALSSAHAAPPSYQELHSNPERALPMQPAWQLRPVDAQALPWEDIFVFTIGIAPELMARSRWLSLNPGEDGERTPALFDTLDGRALFLSPAARSFCDGRWQAVWLERIGINTALQPMHKVWLVERKPEGGQRTTVAYGRIDAQGRWAVPPVRCDGKDTTSVDSPAALSYLMPGDSAQAASELRVDTVAGQPGLRDARGQWRTPLPQRDVATAQWMRDRQELIPPGSTATGLVDAQGRAVIPFIFSELPDATARRRIRLCTAAGQDRQLNASTPRVCRWQRLRGSNADAALLPVKDTDTGRWGYQDA